MSRRLKIGYDAKRLFYNFTGLGNYSRTLVWQMAQTFPEHEYFLYTKSINFQPRTRPFIGNPRFSVITPEKSAFLWRSRGMVRELDKYRMDIYHGLSHELPFGIRKTGIRTVVTIHDLIFKYFPRDYRTIDRYVYDRKWQHACAQADAIVAISAQTKSDLIQFYAVPEEKISVIYQTCDARFAQPVDPDALQAIRGKYRLPKQYLLYVGSIIGRKNLGTLIDAIARIRTSERPYLVVIGDGKAYKKTVLRKISRHGLTQSVKFLRNIPFTDFPAIYQLAQVLVFPSYYEGFGIPVIEAQAAGTPVITSDQSALREAAGDGGYLIDPANPDALAHAIAKVLHDTNLRKKLINAGQQNLARFDGEQLARQLMALYQRLLE